MFTIIDSINVIILATIALVLFHASYEDIRRRDIGSIHVVTFFILVGMHTVINGAMGLQTTYVFLFTFLTFMGISVFSKGHFGIGDSLVISALAWYFGTFIALQNFLYAIGAVAIPWAVYWMIRYRKDNTLKGMLTGFKQTLPIEKVRVGMVLSSDNFMHGLTENDIQKLRHEGYITLTVKQPMPFIPVIFIAFILVTILSVIS